jgi:ABC-type cobalamin/Fe3+-siderophores transport system ATPase subunit
MIKKIHIENYKKFENITIIPNDGLNIIVGDNESGKTTLLEAIYLALRGGLGGISFGADITPHLFNKDAVAAYVKAVKEGKNPELPEIVIELYLEDTKDTGFLRGTNNSLEEDCPGVRVRIAFSQDFTDEYLKFLEAREDVDTVPAEYYRMDRTSFSGSSITNRSLPFGVSLIDASRIRLKSGSDYYMQRIIEDNLTDQQRVELARAYRRLKEEFARDKSIGVINASLVESTDSITDKKLSMSIDVSSQAAWETSLVPHLDDLPFHFAGNGEQHMLKILLALARNVDTSHVILVEEPENHLSFSSLSRLISKIAAGCAGKQVILTTHSSFVINKLGLEQLLLLNGQDVMKLTDLRKDTQAYFKKLAGYDTLRIVLASKTILVEGPSDELVVQRAYWDKHGALPIERGIDVLSVRGLSFKRFLDIAKLLAREVRVVTDNDGDPEKVAAKYKDFNECETIQVFVGSDAALKTLEDQIAGVNDLDVMNALLGTSFTSKSDLVSHMKDPSNKTECALKVFDSETTIKMPSYIVEAIGSV